MTTTPRERFLLGEIESSKKKIAQEEALTLEANRHALELALKYKETKEWNVILSLLIVLLFVFLAFTVTHYRIMQYENMLIKEIHHDHVKTLKLKNDE